MHACPDELGGSPDFPPPLYPGGCCHPLFPLPSPLVTPRETVPLGNVRAPPSGWLYYWFFRPVPLNYRESLSLLCGRSLVVGNVRPHDKDGDAVTWLSYTAIHATDVRNGRDSSFKSNKMKTLAKEYWKVDNFCLCVNEFSLQSFKNVNR